MTTFITLTAPKEPHRHAGPIPEVDALINEARDAAPPTVFHLRADIITEIVPAGTETVIRTSTGGQYVCGETAAQVLEMVQPRQLKDLGELVPAGHLLRP